MKPEYLHDQRITKLIHEMTPHRNEHPKLLEAAQKTLDRYESPEPKSTVQLMNAIKKALALIGHSILEGWEISPSSGQ